MQHTITNLDLDALIAETGNQQGKFTVVSDSDSARKTDNEMLNHNAIKLLSPTQWEMQVGQSAIHMDYNYLNIGTKKAPQYFAVGDAAHHFPNHLSRFAAEKYEAKAQHAKDVDSADYLILQIMSAALYLYKGNLPAKGVNLIIGHPPLNQSQAAKLPSALSGTWVAYDLRGNRHSLKIKGVMPQLEINGAAYHMRFDESGKQQNMPYKGRTITYLDLGGGTFDFTKGDPSTGLPIPATADSRHIGFADAMLDFKDVLDNARSDIFRSRMGVDMDTVIAIANDPKKQLSDWGGDPISFQREWELAMNSTIAAMYQAFLDMSGGIQAAGYAVVVTGGSGDVMFPEIAEYILPIHNENGRLIRADKPRQMIYANMRGFAKLYKAMRNRNLAQRTRK